MRSMMLMATVRLAYFHLSIYLSIVFHKNHYLTMKIFFVFSVAVVLNLHLIVTKTTKTKTISINKMFELELAQFGKTSISLVFYLR